MKVIEFKSAKDLDRDDAVALLEQALEWAREEGVGGVGIIYVTPDGSVAVTASRSSKAHHLMAGTVYLQDALKDEMV